MLKQKALFLGSESDTKDIDVSQTKLEIISITVLSPYKARENGRLCSCVKKIRATSANKALYETIFEVLAFIRLPLKLLHSLLILVFCANPVLACFLA